MFQHLDDPLPLPDYNPQQRQAVLSRGDSLRRRQRVGLLGVPVAAAVVVASAVWVLGVSPGPSGRETLTPAAPPPPPLLSLEEPSRTTMPVFGACPDPVGDSAGEPDVSLFSFDRPFYPFVHYHWEIGSLPSVGVAELKFEATSADGLRSRQLVARTVDGDVVEQFVRDPQTGARLDVPHNAEVEPKSGLSAGFPGGALAGLGDGWAWVGSLSIDGTVVDSCDTEQHGS